MPRLTAPGTETKAVHTASDRPALAVLLAFLRLKAWFDGSGADWSTDASLAGASHESASLEDLGVPVDARSLRPRWSHWREGHDDDRSQGDQAKVGLLGWRSSWTA